MKFRIENEGGLTRVADHVLNHLKKLVSESGSSNKAIIVGLCGNLGSGKTTFMKYFAKELGITEEVTSPTFIMRRRFRLSGSENFPWKNLYHFDMYRVESTDELGPIGFDDTIANPENLVFIEWPEKIASALPRKTTKINFTFIDENTREVEVIESPRASVITNVFRRLAQAFKNVFKK
ncbi:MAG TPA: tRNA (adenosine(37)-N6)-threonylcarbamoyltransferase complex ATPase subunit type 1 TsaE [Candidatus Paceibacterota bacterium]|nr:tRNA (adenosine(37)-N6)-threonylcarbamoyltransferase complex ATPase subunit type 1 TsaE [Candidatus Paceibacterota bacterium]HRZ34220.1 tRNA (adenosine(37)-N6)-threonylcarbamoyltransferase complex ATPase subunit type 1 TsaE [Candidatus Paceibacterota bacterium]